MSDSKSLLEQINVLFNKTPQEEHAQKVLQQTKEAKLISAKKIPILCQYCNQNHEISSWIFIQRKFYVKPYGCTGGDYWDDHKPEVCYAQCPCGRKNYIYNHSQKQEILALITNCAPVDLFKNVVIENDDIS